MIAVSGYHSQNIIYQSDISVVCSAVRDRDNLTVTLKYPQSKSATLEDITQYHKEFETLRRIDSRRTIAVLDIMEQDGLPVLIMEHISYQSLVKILDQRKLTISEAILLAENVAQALDDIHTLNIVYKNISPKNILCSEDLLDLRLVEFGIATFQNVALPSDSNDILEGDINYVSPEQTGRMRRPVDYRSDIYALGVLFYQLLTGQLPFQSSDYVELIFQHLARTPEPPSTLNEDIPLAIDKIVLKLMAKAPEERYQSTHAIISDLARVKDFVLTPTQHVGDFIVGLDDVPEQLFIPSNLLSRTGELKQMEKLVAASARGAFGCIVLSGDSGTGKSALIREIPKLFQPMTGVVSIVKASLVNIDVPNSGIAAVMVDLARLLLSRYDINPLGRKLADELGSSAHLLFSIAPELQRVIRNVPGYEGVRNNPLETRNRLIKAITCFLTILSENVRPLVVCIDNLQWIDHSSLKLLIEINKFQLVPGFMLVLAHRSGGQNEPMVEALLEAKSTLRIELSNLQKHDVRYLLSESLYRSAEEVEDLAILVTSKTRGNPQGIREFLSALNKSDHLFFDRTHREWNWDLEKSSQLPPTNNVGEILARDIASLDSNTIRTLKIAACIGDEFHLDTIKRVSSMSFSETSACLNRAVAEGFLLYKSSDRQSGYHFSHDKIQQSAYILIEDIERKQIHAQIGKTYLAQKDGEDRLFDVVNQLNNSVQDPSSGTDDVIELARLNLEAGRKAKQAGALQASFQYLRTAIAVQGGNVWQNYKLSLEIHLEAAEAAYYCGDKRQLGSLIASTLENATSAIDKSRAYEIQLRAFVAYNDPKMAIDIGHHVLELLGHPVPRTISKPVLAYWTVKTLLRAKFTTQRNHKMKSRESLAAMKILMILCHAGYLSGRPIVAAFTLKMTEISLENGLAPESSFAYPLFGALIINYFGAITTGYQFGTLALENLDERNPELFCRVNTLVHNFISFWKHHLKDTLAPLSEAERIGFETGDIEFAQIAATTRSINGFLLGQELNTLEADFEATNAKASEFNQTPMLSMGLILQEAIRKLKTTSLDPAIIEGELYSEAECIPRHIRDKDFSSMTTLHVVKTFMAVLFREHESSYAYARKARKSLNLLVSSPMVSFFVLFESLAYISQIPSASPFQLPKLRLRVQLNLRLLRKWAQYAPMNAGHGFQLLQAELAAVHEQPTQAIDHYEAAMSLAEKSGYVHILGLTQELTGRFFNKQSKSSLAIFYLRRARSNYVRWGAVAKVHALDQEFDNLVNEQSQYPRRRQLTQYPANTEQLHENFFDLGSVIKASQVLSGEIILETLLEKLMQVAIENAGAHSAGLVLTDGDELYVEILSRYNGSHTDHKLNREDISQTKELPISVIQYVARTEEDLVLNDAPNDDIFTQDDYVVRVKPRSILCFPILSKSHLTGVLYLENLLNTHAFNQDRIAVLKLLASQAAIAIENAKLYKQLNESKNKYLALYENAVEGIFEINSEGELVSANPAAAELIGYDGRIDGESRKVDFSQLFVNAEELINFNQQLNKNQRVVEFETRIRRLDQQERWVAISAHQIIDNNNQPLRLEGWIIDITERKLRQQAEQATRLAEAATLTKSQFLANMSHEIRTPMNAILGYTRLALNTALDEKQSSYLETIKLSSDHLLRVVNDILDISKIESGTLELQYRSFCVESVLGDIDQLFRLKAEEKGLQFVLPPDPIGNYIGDPVRLGQVLINLIGNAIKFTQTGRVTVKLDALPLHDGNHSLNFVVSDTGQGIPESELENIFESFTQITDVNNESGTGLGLAISRDLVRKMQGHIHASSIEGLGSKFYFTVVLEPTTEKIIEPVVAKEIAKATAGNTLLLVEDNPINRDLATEVLQSVGYEVLVTADGLEALDVLNAFPVFCVLMDLRMPRMSGNETIKIIRANADLKNLPVIAVSAGVLQHEIDEALENGFDHYVTKPVDFEALLRLLAEISGVEAQAKLPISQPKATGPIILDVDFGLALKNHDYDEYLLNRLTLDFVDIYGDSANRLRQTLNQDDIEHAERLMHNIAAVAGSFGANKLMLDCRRLEHLIRDLGDLKADQIDLFEQELRNLMDAIEQYQSGVQKQANQA
ncbi:MAG: PAS domain S-box-containing protein [Planctomycetaceae bacterium]|jgi:PAS domain S-box-containing protein